MPSETASAARRSPAQKIRSVAELGALAAEARLAGRTVVYSHGVFDLMHFGHLRHLEAARRLGDVLVVTVTADQYVNKGPGRPVFPALVRAEMLAALEIVDWVAINDAPLSVPVIETIKPTIYVKGSDYVQAQDDVTGGIAIEQQAVEKHDGKLVFTDEVTYSSSTLINKYLAIYDPEVDECLRVMRERNVLGEMLRLIEKMKDLRVLIVGDAIIDEYQYVQPMSKASKENLIATLYRDHELFAGGVVAAANHAAGFCAQVDVVTALGADDSHLDLIRSRLKPNVGLKTLMRPGAPTTRKCRFVDHGNMRKLFEVYFMDETPLDKDLEEELNAHLAAVAGSYDLVIVTDFGHGLISERTIRTMRRHAKFLAVNAQTNSANYGFNPISRYPEADYVCIDAPEARLATGEKFADIAEVATEKLPALVDCPNFVITHGVHGCVAYRQRPDAAEKDFHRIPAFTKTAVDTIGAGDAFLAVTSPLTALGAPLDLVGFIGNAVGAMKVSIVGHRHSVEKAPLIKFITALLK